MDWNDHFGIVFFETWKKAGLPHHQEYVNEYIELREHGRFKTDWIKNSPAISPNIHGAQLISVYGFGVVTGKIFAEMFGLNDDISENTSDWCGRFNLGISLFDYICDEMDGLSSVSSLKVFQPFMATIAANTQSIGPAEVLLSRLARSVLQDLKKAEGKNRKGQKSNSLLKAMKQMFEAENFISKTKLSESNDLYKIEKALYLKSAEPFRVMAEFTARMADNNNDLQIKNVRLMGKALGYCYWLIDDARDVWIDLKAGHWNLFLKQAAVVDPQIFAKKPDLTTENNLKKIWEEASYAQKISNQIIERVVNATQKLKLSPKVENHTLGLVSASLWQWYQY